MSKSTIEWTQETWNPVRGCSRISPGCQRCYAERMAARNLPGMKSPTTGEPFAIRTPSGPRWTGKVEMIPEMVDVPFRRRKPTTYFVNSMSDLFHEGLPFDDILYIFLTMQTCPQHTFQVLTKRADRMESFFAAERATRASRSLRALDWPLPNVWLGVSVEDQQRADERIPLLLQTPAAVRFLSVEPLLEPVDLGLNRWVRLPRAVVSELPFPPIPYASKGVYRAESNRHGALAVRADQGELLGIKPGEFERFPNLDWVIVGGESGPGARPCDVAHVRSIVEQCKAASVACFVKQLGAHVIQDGGRRIKKDRKGGDMHEWPHDIRVREMPQQGEAHRPDGRGASNI